MVPKTYFFEEFYLNPILEKRNPYRFETAITDFSKDEMGVLKSCIRDVNIAYLGKIEDLFFFDVFTRKVTFASSHSIENERLLKEDMYAFDDILLGVNDKGEIVKVQNLEEIQNKWQQTKSELRKDYQGHEFEGFLSDVTEVLENDQDLVYYLNTYAMFGLYFHGLFGKYDTLKMPLERKKILLDFDDSEITEQIWTDTRVTGFVMSAKKSDDTNKKIITNNVAIQEYQGSLAYNSENELMEGDLNIKSENKNLNYNILWVG